MRSAFNIFRPLLLRYYKCYRYVRITGEEDRHKNEIEIYFFEKIFMHAKTGKNDVGMRNAEG